MDTNQPPNLQQSTPPSSGSKNTGMAIIAYLGILVIIPLITEAKNDPFVKYHCKQGLVLLIGWIIAFFVFALPSFGFFFGPLLWLCGFILMIIGIINAASGQMKELPIIGQFASKFNF